MGTGPLAKDRYIGGKKLRKYYGDDLLPGVIDLFTFLQVPEVVGFACFKTFANLDEKEIGIVESEVLTDFFQGHKSKFTERIFHQRVEEDTRKFRTSFNFREFFVAVWSFCSLNTRGIARYLYEIYDPDNGDALTKYHVMSMFRMLYCTEDIAEEYLSPYLFSSKSTVDKVSFIEQTNKSPILIRPALRYQTFLRQRLGGKGSWQVICTYRSKHLSKYDLDCETLAESVQNILEGAVLAEEKRRPITADSLLEARSVKLQEDLDIVAKELRARTLHVQSEKLRASIQDPSLPMKRSWAIFEACKQDFIAEEFLIEDGWRRREARLNLFSKLDDAVAKSIEYYQWKDKKDVEIAEGIPADHEARYMDYIQTEQGKVIYTVLLLLRLYQFVLQQIVAKLEKMRRRPAVKSEKQAIVENGINDLTPIYHNICIECELNNNVSAAERSRQWLIIKSRNFEEEFKIAKKLLSKTELHMVEVDVHAELCAALKARTIETTRISIAQGQEERRKDYSAKEHDLSMNYGSRITRYEFRQYR
ncbi:hypothetical protein EON65_08965 [archaeon]|nr:MAG: hypothetical protein EON65_08965 [archaeon]